MTYFRGILIAVCCLSSVAGAAPLLRADDVAALQLPDVRITSAIHIAEGAAEAKAKAAFTALGEGGKVEMPFEKTFWAKGFGILKDRFGVSWMINLD